MLYYYGKIRKVGAFILRKSRRILYYRQVIKLGKFYIIGQQFYSKGHNDKICFIWTNKVNRILHYGLTIRKDEFHWPVKEIGDFFIFYFIDE